MPRSKSATTPSPARIWRIWLCALKSVSCSAQTVWSQKPEPGIARVNFLIHDCLQKKTFFRCFRIQPAKSFNLRIGKPPKLAFGLLKLRRKKIKTAPVGCYSFNDRRRLNTLALSENSYDFARRPVSGIALSSVFDRSVRLAVLVCLCGNSFERTRTYQKI